jgi:hypothetical protein
MMKVLVTLTRVGREEPTRFWFRLFKEVSVGARQWEDMVLLHFASSVLEDSGLANAEVPLLIIREMPLDSVLIAHSSPPVQTALVKIARTAMARQSIPPMPASVGLLL